MPTSDSATDVCAFTTPVALIIFNRPDFTRRVLNVIRRIRPTTLLVVADGPRPSRAGEAQRCAEARAVIDTIDWPCNIIRHYAETNLGCRVRVSSGIDWIFRTVEEAIVLEDDCVPDESFFPYCGELLARYRDEPRVMSIAGTTFLPRPRSEASYYFSRFTHVWGWASWRRAWARYDVGMATWPAVRDAGELKHVIPWPRDARRFTRILDRVYEGDIDTWDYQWAYAAWLNGGISVIPSVNLITNIGFGADATHTTVSTSFSDRMADRMVFPLRHPLMLQPDLDADRWTQRHAMRPQWRSRLRKGIQLVRRRLLGGD